MAGIYIAGMQMPKTCKECPFRVETYLLTRQICIANNREEICEGIDKIDNSCPLVAVPDHGRLIDTDALREAVGKVEAARRQEYCALSEAEKECEYEQGVWDGVHMVAKMISVAPTVIPVDKEAAE